MSVFDDVKAIEALDEMRCQARDRGHQLLKFSEELSSAYETHRKDAEAHPTELSRCADAAREMIERGMAMDLRDPTSGVRVRASESEPTKRGRGPDRQPRQRRGTTNETKETKPAPEREQDVTMLMSLMREEPATMAGLEAQLGWTAHRIIAALDDPAFTTWTMQRDGDSEPVAVWGTVAQRDAYVNSIPIQTRAKVPDAPK